VEFAMSLEVNAITLVVPFPPGGSTDFTARILAERLAEVLERPVDVVTRTGDFGYNAVRALLAGSADSTFLIGNVNSNSVMPVVLRGRAEFDHWQVVQPITRLAEFPSVVCTHMRFPADTLDAFIAHLKRTTGRVRYGTDFLGTFVDVDIIDMCDRVGLERACKTVNGALGILQDLEAELTDLAMLNVATATANTGRLKPLAISGPNRLKNFPGVPTLAECGLAGIGTSNWQALLASRQASPEIVRTLHKAAVEAMEDCQTMQHFAAIDARVSLSESPEQFEVQIKAEAEQWQEYAGAIVETPLLAG
jgi:tripartite-type tricarboxylate transporter receptor subunit TctC